MDQQEKDKILDRLVASIEKAYHRPGRLMWRGFLIGLASGIGGTLGIALVIILLTLLVGKLGGIPVIGEALRDLLEIINRGADTQSFIQYVRLLV
jgi:hypothetical protein